jgi:hypothetical protein
MKTIFRFSMSTLILAFIFTGCDKLGDLSGESGKLSPPSWIQGSWTPEDVPQIVALKCSSDDVIWWGQSIKQIWGSNSSLGVGYTIKETKNTGSIYEITIKASSGVDHAAAMFSFKKGDGSYIEAATIEDGERIYDDDYVRLNKKN